VYLVNSTNSPLFKAPGGVLMIRLRITSKLGNNNIMSSNSNPEKLLFTIIINIQAMLKAMLIQKNPISQMFVITIDFAC
jgi:hypothetical protein